MNFIQQISSKCGQGEESHKIQKIADFINGSSLKVNLVAIFPPKQHIGLSVLLVACSVDQEVDAERGNNWSFRQIG